MRRNVLLVVMLLAEGLVPVRAQGHRSGDMFVAVRAGANMVGNTYRFRERRPEPGGGGSVGTYISPRWALEFEAWFRSSNPECCGPREPEVLYSLSVIRPLARQGLQPYMLGGITRLQGHRHELQAQIGVGAKFPIVRRLEVALDLRGNGGGSTMIVRPTAAVIYYLR